MQQKIIFKSKGLNCSGLFYLPDNYSATDDVKLPAIAMAHGMGTTKEVGLPQFAERFADAGFAVLIFDFRNLGESEGTPRGQIFAEDQQEDYRNAITWLQLQSQIDPERIGVWGFSFSGGHVLQVAAFDRRIKCVVAQVPAVSGFLLRKYLQAVRASGSKVTLWPRRSSRLTKDRRIRFTSIRSKWSAPSSR